MSVWRWANQFSPEIPAEMQTSLGEGETPCIASRSIGLSLGLPQLYFKLETANPSGSYKDRFAATAISYMCANGQHTCLATSSGNTGAALAAYCAAARIRCRIAVVETAPLAKLQQMMAHGAEIQRVRGFGVDAATNRQVFEYLQRQACVPGFAMQVSAYRWSPLGMQGVESIGYELGEQFSAAVGHVFCPAGGGGLTFALCADCDAPVRKPPFTASNPRGTTRSQGPCERDATVPVMSRAKPRSVACRLPM